MDRFFHVTEKGSTVRTEIMAGITTFMAMAYILMVNAGMFASLGTVSYGAIYIATAISAVIGTVLIGLLSNLPLAQASGMGLNAFFVYTVCFTFGLSYANALVLVFVDGIVFVLLTVTGLRKMIFDAIPAAVKTAISAGIGLFIAFIGLKGAGIVVADPATTVALGDLTTPTAALALFGLVLTGALLAWRIRAAVLVGILATTALAWAVGAVHWTPVDYSVEALTSTAFRLDIPTAFVVGGKGAAMAMVEIVVVFLFVDLFDNVGTLVAVTQRAGLAAPDGSIPRINRILLTDAAAAIFGALAGTTTTTSYIESAAGVAAGGRTGLTAVVVGLLFLVALVFAPFAQIIPAAATAPALILVGALMMAPLAASDWDDQLVAIPGFLTLVAIPLTFSIANGLAFGIVAYALLKLARGQARVGDWMLYLLAALFIARFIWLAVG